MPVPRSMRASPSVAGPLGSLAFSGVRPRSASLALRALGWWVALQRLGVELPLFVVHDLGLLLTAPPNQLELGPRVPDDALAPLSPAAPAARAAYLDLVREISRAEAVQEAGRLRLHDDLAVVVLARMLGGVAARSRTRAPDPAAVPYDLSLFEGIDAELPTLARVVPRRHELGALEALADGAAGVLTLVDALDVGTLELFGVLGPELAGGALDQVDLLAALEAPEVADMVRFSLEILPCVLEATAPRAAGPEPADGYAGLGTRGSLDSVVLTELSWDDEELSRRLLEHEVLYYAREQASEHPAAVHVLLIDASASMRGDRQTFARGLAVATGKKLLLEGHEVQFRFFDARLYEPRSAPGGRLPLAHLLAFRGERGRNPARVFAALATELQITRRRERRPLYLHLFTHAALYIPRPVVQELRRHGHVAAVFMLPSGGAPRLDYLDLLSRHWVIDHATLAARAARAAAARAILGGVGGTLGGAA